MDLGDASGIRLPSSGRTLPGGRDEYQRRVEDTDLLEAAKAGDVARAQRLLDAGADPRAVDLGGYSAVWFAAAAGHAAMVRLLLGKGASLPAQRSEVGRQLALYCTHSAHASVLELLRAGQGGDDRLDQREHAAHARELLPHRGARSAGPRRWGTLVLR